MALDADDLKKINELIAAAKMKPEELAAAVTPVVEAHVKAATKDLPTADALGKTIAAEVAKLKPADDPEKGAKGKGEDKDNPQVAALQKQLDEQKAQLEAAERKRVDAERARVADSNRNAARAALSKAGIPEKDLDDALAIVGPQLQLDGDKVGWRGKDQYGLDAVLPFESGAATWVKSDSGKRFLPPVDQGGTGGNPGGREGGGGAKTAKLADLRSTDILGSLANAIG